jgi:4'-phosphopantetheinyl transferase
MVLYAMEHPQAQQLAHTLLARSVQLEWGLSPLPQLQRTQRGKPFFPDYPQFHFNLSHSGQVAVCALDSTPVGVDVQQLRPFRSALLDSICSPQERDWLRHQGDDQRACALLWSLKESRCKQSGQGLRRPIAAIAVPLPQHEESCLAWEGLRFYLHSSQDWQLALCGCSNWNGQLHWVTL